MRERKQDVVISLLLLTLSMVTSAPPSAAAQQQLSDHPHVEQALNLVDAWLKAEVAYRHIPGLSIAIVHGQELVQSTGYGRADLNADRPANGRTLYRACSIVKMFTATAVMQLRDQGRLELEDSVRALLPWFRPHDDPSTSGPVTVESLLTHSSGLPRDLPFPYWTGPDYPFPTQSRFIEEASEIDLVYPPRTRSQYSNVGMTLAGQIVSAVSGQPFDSYLRRHIFEPLGLSDTRIDEGGTELRSRLASGYTVVRRDGTRKRVPDYDVGALSPAAGLISTVEDLARFASWQFRVLDGASDPVLHTETLRSMHRVQWMEPDGWSRSGYGYQTWAENDRHFVGHAGACPGYESKLLLRPQEKFAVAIMTNSQGPNVDGYGQRIYDAVAPAIRRAVADPDARVAAESPERGIEDFTGRYQRPFGGETVVFRWNSGLGILRVPNDDPIGSLETYEPVGGGVFRRTGTTEGSADVIRFERDQAGGTRMWHNHQFSVRLESR